MRTPSTLTRLVAELRELPDGLATPVRADYLISDVLEALGYPPAGVGELVGRSFQIGTTSSRVGAQDAPGGVVAVLR